MSFDYNKLVAALGEAEDAAHISKDVIVDALKEAYTRAYKKTIGLDDINVEAVINEKNKSIDIYQIYKVVENVEDDELEMDLEEARKWKPDAVLNDEVRLKVDVNPDEMSRAAASQARSVLKQKIREAEKAAVYDAYIDKLHDMVLGVVESVRDKFALINLGKTMALMPRSAQIPGERLVEGQHIRVVITDVNKDSKGSQVLVSRADPMLVRRLFEREISEIQQGIVEIKAIARDPGDRTKMAVISYNPEVDPIGACIGQRGSRVQQIIEELHGEKIDIFQWSDDISTLVKNALSPAEVQAVLPGDDDKSLLVVVDEDQLSLAIGKRGRNARLAVQLVGRKIDIKTRAQLEEEGVDYEAKVALAAQKKAEEAEARARRNAEKKKEEAAAVSPEEQKKNEMIAAARAQVQESLAAEGSEVIPEEMQETLSNRARAEVFNAPEEPAVHDEEETVENTAAEVPPEKPAVSTKEPVTEEAPAAVPEEKVEKVEEVKPVVRHHKADLEEMAQKNDYVSVFEKLADTSKPRTETRPRKRFKKKSDDDNVKLSNAELMKQLSEKNKDLRESMKPVYSEEELAEIEAQEEAEEENQFDIDYDEYEDYYKDEENGK